MEATIKQTNISANVSINIGVLNDVMQSTKQHLWFMVKGSWLRVAGAWSLPRLYRKALRLEQYIEKAIGDHPVITDAALVLMGIGIIAEVVLFC